MTQSEQASVPATSATFNDASATVAHIQQVS